MKNPKPRNKVLTFLLLAGLLIGSRAATAASDGAQQAALYSDASALYRAGRWSGAYGRFATLADQGHQDAARIAMHMLRMGSTLYGTDWGASQPQIDLWSRLVATPLPRMQSVTGD